ncbi:MAG: nicotinate-nucleotide adenylyltransferase [Planctomycetota bacterium]|jgi:nicotinate-nucleotide adenylyltransferase|nr:nicotinate-nucleotide adenylyltransferase [Planctomycetota bacterium]
MRIGVFGGSFDPVHLGHLIAAECCREQAGLDRVLFVPAAVPPHKQDRQLSPAADRVEMLRLAVGGHDAFAVSTLEIDRGGVSFTVDTLVHLRETHPADEFFLLLGPDAIVEFPAWREPLRILDLATPLVMMREVIDNRSMIAGDARLATLIGRERLTAIVSAAVQLPAIGIRASDLRAAVAAGRSIRFRTPRAVEAYVKVAGLYRSV